MFYGHTRTCNTEPFETERFLQAVVSERDVGSRILGDKFSMYGLVEVRSDIHLGPPHAISPSQSKQLPLQY